MDFIPIQGAVTWQARKNGEILFRESKPNLITTAGKAYLADRISANGAGGLLIDRLKAGDDATAPEVGQSNLQGATLFSVAMDVAGGTQVGNTIRWTTTFTTGFVMTIREFGIFDTDPHTLMLARFLPTSIQITSDTSVDVVWTLSIGGFN